MQIDVTEAHWYDALTLLERHQALTGVRDSESDGESEVAAGDALIAGRPAMGREERWRRSGPLARPGLFDRRLAAEGLTSERFRRVVGCGRHELRTALEEPPAWLSALAAEWCAGRAMDLPPFEEASPLRMPEPPGRTARTESAPSDDGDGGESGMTSMLGLVRGVRPLMSAAFARFRVGLDALLTRCPDAPVSRVVGERVFMAGLTRQVAGLVGRTMVLELNVARLKGELDGETGEARFRSFVDRLDDRGDLDGAQGDGQEQHEQEAEAWLREYPLLARVVLRALEARVEGRLECLRHLCEDWEAIVRRWPALAGARLAEVSVPLGDPHAGGRVVLGMRFDRGGDLVYKPRSLAVDVHFQDLLAWLNARGARPAFRTIEVLDRIDHGWMEALPAVSCESREAVARFYERLGGLLAVLYALEATDMHFENLVAWGEHPVLVDLESLFHPRPGQELEGVGDGVVVEASTDREPTARRLAAEALHDSVLRVGLLPQRIWSRAEFAGIDLSGCGGEPGQRLPQGVPVWEGEGTDTMRLAERMGALPASANRPMLAGRPVDLLEHAGALERGFASTYRLLCDLRPRLLEEHGPIRRFAADRVRAILRPTRVYGLLLQESTHPDVLRNALDRDRLFDWLWADVERQPWLVRVIAAERHDLERGDVPCFTTSPGSRSIWTSAGVQLADCYASSGLERVEDRLRAMGEIDLARQCWFLRASLTSLVPAEARVGWAPGVAALALPVSPDVLIEAAARVAHRLGALAFVDGTRASWVGVTLVAEERWALVPLGLDLYGGLPGIALFLARLASVTGDVRHRRLAVQTVTSVLEQIESEGAWSVIGAFAGWGGVIYALVHVGVLLQDERCLVCAESLVPRVRANVRTDVVLDIVGGAAGAIMALAALQAVRPSDDVLAVIRQCAAHLVARAEDQPVGCAWRTTMPARAPLLGFSHGAGGMALALLTAAALTDEEPARETARRAIAYERSSFCIPVKNWPDFRLAEVSGARRRADIAGRPSGVEGRFMTAWCHGAPGIGLARLAALRFQDDWRTRVELAEAVQATLREGFGLSHCLCHGDLGNLEFLAIAAAKLGDTALRRDVAQMAAGVLQAGDERGWRCGVPLQVETPGFMMGLAGIGDGLLRIAEPGLASVLMLEPPRPLTRVRRGPAEGPAAPVAGEAGDVETPPGDDASASVAARRR